MGRELCVYLRSSVCLLRCLCADLPPEGRSALRPGKGRPGALPLLECGICIPKCYARAIRSGSEKIVVSHDRYVILNSAKERRGDVQ